MNWTCNYSLYNTIVLSRVRNVGRGAFSNVNAVRNVGHGAFGNTNAVQNIGHGTFGNTILNCKFEFFCAGKRTVGVVLD